MKLKMEFGSFKSESSCFWKDSKYILELFNIFKKYGLLNSIKYYNEGDSYFEIESFEELAQGADNWSPGGYYFVDNPVHDQERTELWLTTREPSLRIDYIIDLSAQDMALEDFMEPFKQVLKELVELFDGVAAFWPAAAVSILGYEYPKVRPYRDSGSFGDANLIDGFSRSMLEKKGHPYVDNDDELNCLIEDELPPGVKREVTDELITIQWVTEAWSDAEIKAALTRREEWLYSRIEFELDDRYNESGDYREFYLTDLPDSKDSAGFFTVYDPVGKVGFKTIITTSDGDIEEDVKVELIRLLSQGSLDDGRKLETVKLITPIRSRAIKVYPRAKEIGVDSVYYTDNEGALWELCPDE